MKLKIEMSLDNSAFAAEYDTKNSEEVKRILAKMCRDNGNFRKGDGGALRDINGQIVGKWGVV